MDKLISFAETDGIVIEQRQRIGRFNMRTKHFHNEYEVFYIIRGQRRFFINNRAYFVQQGDLILMEQNKIHMTSSVDEHDQGHERMILYIGKKKLVELDELFARLGLVRFFRDHYGVFHLNEEQQQQFLSMYRSLERELTQKQRGYKAMADMEIIRYFVSFMRDNAVQKLQEMGSDQDSRYKFVYAAADYISEHFDEKISLDELAGRFFLSKYYFCRTFKEITGYGISEYINIHRIQKATRLLEETEDSVSSIANTLGYESLTYFEKVFKNYMNVSPLRYRKTLIGVTYGTAADMPSLLDDAPDGEG